MQLLSQWLYLGTNQCHNPWLPFVQIYITVWSKPDLEATDFSWSKLIMAYTTIFNACILLPVNPNFVKIIILIVISHVPCQGPLSGPVIAEYLSWAHRIMSLIDLLYIHLRFCSMYTAQVVLGPSKPKWIKRCTIDIGKLSLSHSLMTPRGIEDLFMLSSSSYSKTLPFHQFITSQCFNGKHPS